MRTKHSTLRKNCNIELIQTLILQAQPIWSTTKECAQMQICNDKWLTISARILKWVSKCVAAWKNTALFPWSVNWIDNHNRVDEDVTIRNCRINRFQIADDLVLLASSKSLNSLQHALYMVSAACHQAGMENVTRKTEVLRLSRNPRQCALDNFKYLGVVFTSGVKQNEQMDTRIGKANALLRATHRSVVTRRELSNTA